MTHRIEEPAVFERAATDGERLWLAYRSTTRNRDGRNVGTRRRAVALRLGDLASEREFPVEAFPLERLRPARIPWNELIALPLRSLAEPGEASLVLVPGDERAAGLLLHTVPGAPGRAHLRAEVLVQRRHAVWGYALLPLALAWDAAVLPPLALLGVPLFGWTQ